MVSSDVQLNSIEEALRTKYWHWSLYKSVPGCQSLRSFLISALPHIAPSSWPERWDFGGVYINGLRQPLETTLTYPCKIEYYEPKFAIAEAAHIFPSFESHYIIYQDEALAVVYKPPGLSSMPAKEQHHFSLKASVEKEIGTTIHMPSRLDVSAQGLVIVSTSIKTHAKLQQAFENRCVKKLYLCASHARPNWQEHRVTSPISRDPLHPVLRSTSHAQGQSAETIFTTLDAKDYAYSVFSARPITGRTHQIRVHAASLGLPLLGDRFYCGAPAEHLHLVSYALSLQHPINEAPISFELPKRFLPSWVPPQLPELRP